jgi:hypothetical protein
MGLAALVAASVLASGAGPVSATMPDGAYARFALMEEEGLVFLSYTGATTVNAGVLGLMANEEYLLRGSSQGCNHMPNPANKVFGVKGMTNDRGGLWLRRSPSIGAVVHSVWLGPTDDSKPPVCAQSLNFEEVRMDYPKKVMAIWDKDHVLSLLVRKPNNRARLDLVIDAGSGDHQVTLRGSDRRCGARPTQRFFDVYVDVSGFGLFDTEMLSITPDEIGMLRSIRLGGDMHGCANIIAILIG